MQYCLLSVVHRSLNPHHSLCHPCSLRSPDAKPHSLAAVDSIKLPLDLSSKPLLLVSLTRSSDVSELTTSYGGGGVPVLGTLTSDG